MRYGFYLPTRGPLATPESLEQLVQRAEALGFSSVVIADHIVQPVTIESKYPYTVSGAFSGTGDSLEQLALMAYIAAKTSKLRLITSVMIVPHRNPLVTAKSLATIDVLSGGRVTVGVGVGWLREEFAALHAPDFDRRGAVTNEYLRIFKTVWTQAPASFTGEFYAFGEIWCLPQPVQKPHPPIWIGGESPAAIRRAARYGDGWHPIGANPLYPLGPRELRAKLLELHRLAEAAGRDPSSLAISYKDPQFDVNSTTPEPQADGQRRPFSGPPEQILADIETYAALGVGELIVDFRGGSVEERVAGMQRFAELVGIKAGA